MTIKRVFKLRPDSQAGLEVTARSTRVSGSRENVILVDDNGVYIVGPISILTEPNNIRLAGGYTFPEAYKGALPSSTVNPQPQFIANSPVEGFSSIADLAAELLGDLL